MKIIVFSSIFILCVQKTAPLTFCTPPEQPVLCVQKTAPLTFCTPSDQTDCGSAEIKRSGFPHISVEIGQEKIRHSRFNC